MKSEVEKHLDMLGRPMKDIVTGISGMVDSIAFDVYGCVQATMRGKAKKDGSLPECNWMDVQRLRPDGNKKRVLPVPAHMTTPAIEVSGPAEKPRID